MGVVRVTGAWEPWGHSHGGSSGDLPQHQVRPSCATVSGGVPPWLPLIPPPNHAPRPDRPAPAPDRNPPVDRENARKNMAAGLIAAGIATGVFALAFVVALFYIAQ